MRDDRLKDDCQSKRYPGENPTSILVDLPPCCTVHQNTCGKIDHFTVWMDILAQVFGEAVEHLAGASPAQMRRLGSIDTIEVGTLLGPRQRGSTVHWDKFDGGDGDGAAHAIGVHLVAVDDSLLRDDVVVGGVI